MPQIRILVVDDEPLIRLITVDALTAAGYDVSEAATAAEAMMKFSGNPTFAAAIIDLGLPDRPGDALVNDIRAASPALPIVIASGRGDAQLVRRFRADAQTRILPKPYGEEALINALVALGVAIAHDE